LSALNGTNSLNLPFISQLKIMDGTERRNIKVGAEVKIVLKADQRSGVLTEGVVATILTKSPNHTHGIKVRLETGEVGRVKEVIEDTL
jgi:uncharacterized repeat protein (TIGR03833 family)